MLFVAISSLLHGISAYMLIDALTEDITIKVSEISAAIQWKTRDSSELFKQLFDFIQYHSTVKMCVYSCVGDTLQFGSFFLLFFFLLFRYAFNSSRVYQPVFMILFTCNIITICIACLLILMELVSVKQIATHS